LNWTITKIPDSVNASMQCWAEHSVYSAAICWFGLSVYSRVQVPRQMRYFHFLQVMRSFICIC